MCEFKQGRKLTCGVTVCRRIVWVVLGECFSESEILERINKHEFSDNSWKEKFLNDDGPMPTEMLVELLENLFNIRCKTENNFPTLNIEKETLVVVEDPPQNYHAISFQRLDNDNNQVVYLDPWSGHEETKSIADFDRWRTRKNIGNEIELLEILFKVV